MNNLSKKLQAKKLIFWDFDGVIKDSLEVKSNAFYNLFLPFGSDIAKRVKNHHEFHCGISRYQKLPIYLKWANQDYDPENIEKFAICFGELVKQAVIRSPWVPGVLQYLKVNKFRQKFILVTATPHAEILDIVENLEIRDCFCQIYGSPNVKSRAIVDTLNSFSLPKSSAILIGDSQADLDAALNAEIDFILRRTHKNLLINHTDVINSFRELQIDYD